MKQQKEEKVKSENNTLDVYFNFIGNCQAPQKANMENYNKKMW